MWPGSRLLLGLALFSAAGLALEVVLTRIFSVVLPYHTAYLALGVAVSGIALGAAVSARRDVDAPAATLQFAALTVLALGLTRWLPAQDIPWIYGAAWALPFIPLGRVVSGLFRRYPGWGGRLYAADLAGAGAGGAAGWALLYLGAAEAVLATAIAAVLSAPLMGAARSGRGLLRAIRPVAAFLIVTLLLVVQFQFGLFAPLPIAPSPLKDRLHAQSMKDSELLASRWSPFGRTDALLESGGMIGLFVDGAAGAIMLADSTFGDPWGAGAAALARYSGGLALRLTLPAQRDSILVIGAGGGRDVVAALHAGFRHVLAVEVNPEIVALNRELDDYNGGLFTRREGVHLIQAEGRSWVERSRARFDVIFLGLPLTKSSRAPFGYTLTESYLITRESLATYWDRLTPEGMIVVVGHGPEEMYRLVRTSVEALQERSLDQTEVMARTYILPDPMNPVWVLMRTPVDEALSAALHALRHPEPIYFLPGPSWVPGLETRTSLRLTLAGTVLRVPMLDPLLEAVARGALPVASIGAVSDRHIPAISDTRPFFYGEAAGIPRPLRQLLLFSLFLLATGSIFVWTRREADRWRDTSAYLAGAAAGAGYMTVEIALLQEFSLVLGAPAAATVLLLPALLVGSAAGALLGSGRIGLKGSRRAFAGTASMAGAAALLLPLLASWLLPAPGIPRMVFPVLITLLAGAVMGLPLPRLLGWADRTQPQVLSPVIWTGNAVGSVLGSALALSVAVTAGFAWALLSGAICYLLGAGTLGRLEVRLISS